MSESPDIVGLIGEHVSEMTLSQAEEVERRILNGEDEIEVPYLLSVRPDDPRTLKYTVPKWRRAPRDRLRIEMARREHRGEDPFPGFLDPVAGFVILLLALTVLDRFDVVPHLLVLAVAFLGAIGMIFFTRWKLARMNKKPYTRIAELEREAEEGRLKAADILVKLQADLLKLQSMDTREHAREAYNRSGQLVEKAFKDLVPEKWWKELAEFDRRDEAREHE
jgi:hypothetical protein